MDDNYNKLLDRAFEKAPEISEFRDDFVIPKADSFVEGNKTIIKNIVAIADNARREASDIGKYISKELAVPVSLDKDRLVINGKFNTEDLNKKIKTYFELYVICRECKKPDSHLESVGRGMLYFVCEACGARYGIKSY